MSLCYKYDVYAGLNRFSKGDTDMRKKPMQIVTQQFLFKDLINTFDSPLVTRLF